MKVTNAQELTEAPQSDEKNIEIEGTITGSPSITLPEGFALSGGTLKSVRVEADQVFVRRADVRGRVEQPHGDGAIGIQVSKLVGSIEVAEDVHTTGSEGLSLAKGVQMTLKAIGVSIKPGRCSGEPGYQWQGHHRSRRADQLRGVGRR